MKNKIPTIIIAVLFLLVLGFGYFLYSGQSLSLPTSLSLNKTDSVQPESSSPELTEDEKKALDGLGKTDASEDERNKHLELVQEIAKQTTTLFISGCQPRPAVMRLRNGTKFTVQNDDATDRIIVLDKERKFTIPANKSKQFDVDFGKGPGLYGYGCDSSTVGVGIFLVTEPE